MNSSLKVFPRGHEWPRKSSPGNFRAIFVALAQSEVELN
jgi:hypothetical protein